MGVRRLTLVKEASPTTPKTQELKRSPLDGRHRALGARMVPFAGWEMPLQFDGIVQEHHAVRQRAGLFDVSHMGRQWITGADAAALVRCAVSYDVARLEPGRGHYTLLCREDGGILDDPYVYRLAPDRLLFVGNAANAGRDHRVLAQAQRPGLDACVEEVTAATVMLALQGPEAMAHLARVVSPELAAGLGRRRVTEIAWGGGRLVVSRTGYTGEDGVETVTDVETGRALWDALLADGVQPCGLGARDSLRLEAALALYGNDIDESTNPYEARLGWVVGQEDGAGFTGRAALLEIKAREPRRLLSCLKALERGVLRHGQEVRHNGTVVGTLTSGGFSPTLVVAIGMAYLPVVLAEEGTRLEVDVRGRPLPVVVVPRPFYKHMER